MALFFFVSIVVYYHVLHTNITISHFACTVNIISSKIMLFVNDPTRSFGCVAFSDVLHPFTYRFRTRAVLQQGALATHATF